MQKFIVCLCDKWCEDLSYLAARKVKPGGGEIECVTKLTLHGEKWLMSDEQDRREKKCRVACCVTHISNFSCFAKKLYYSYLTQQPAPHSREMEMNHFIHEDQPEKKNWNIFVIYFERLLPLAAIYNKHVSAPIGQFSHGLLRYFFALTHRLRSMLACARSIRVESQLCAINITLLINSYVSQALSVLF